MYAEIERLCGGGDVAQLIECLTSPLLMQV